MKPLDSSSYYSNKFLNQVENNKNIQSPIFIILTYRLAQVVQDRHEIGFASPQ